MDAIIVLFITAIVMEIGVSPRLGYTRTGRLLLWYTNPKTGSRDYVVLL
jgi:hypothetical protein